MQKLRHTKRASTTQSRVIMSVFRSASQRRAPRDTRSRRQFSVANRRKPAVPMQTAGAFGSGRSRRMLLALRHYFAGCRPAFSAAFGSGTGLSDKVCRKSMTSARCWSRDSPAKVMLVPGT